MRALAAGLLALAACRSGEQIAASGSQAGSGSGSGSSAAPAPIAAPGLGSAVKRVETPATAEACAAAGATMRSVTASSPVEGMYPGIALDVSTSLQEACTRLPWPTSFADCLAGATTVESQQPCVDAADPTVVNTFRLVLSNAKRAAIAKHGGVAGSGSGSATP